MLHMSLQYEDGHIASYLKHATLLVMKSKIALITVLVLSVSSVFSQDSTKTEAIPNSIIKFLPFELISSTFMIEVEGFNKQGTRSTSFGIGATYSERTDFEEEKVSGVKGELIHRIYITPFSERTSKKGRDYMLGIYGGLFVRGGYEKIEHEFFFSGGDQTNTREGTWVFPGAMIGVSRTYWDKLLVDLYLGAGIRVIDVSDSNREFQESFYSYTHISPLDYGGVAPNIGIKIGLWL